mgnify:CR=1 FL=1
MFEWILIILVVAAIFYAGDLPKVKAFLQEKGKIVAEKAKEKKAELEAKAKEKKEDKE